MVAGVDTLKSRPRARKDLELQEVGQEGFLYDREGELIHILNITALEIWKACDGTRAVDGIEVIVRSKFSGLDASDVRGDIEKLLADLARKGLLEVNKG